MAKTRTKNKPTARGDKAARCWFELKNVHKRSSQYLIETANLFKQYYHPTVSKKIAKNGDGDEFNQLLKDVNEKLIPIGENLSRLWDQHKDKNRLCYNYTELTQAFKLFEEYQRFDLNCFDSLHPIVSRLNEIFNKALQELLDTGKEVVDPSIDVITDLEFKDTPLSDISSSNNTENVERV